jgi:secondary thiamine-phosphate synthase enzyme
MSTKLDTIQSLRADRIATGRLSVQTTGRGFVEITADVKRFLKQADGRDGMMFLYLRHTSASLVIGENAAPDVPADLTMALDRLAPENAGWRHDSEGPDDMPAHVKTMLTGVSLHSPAMGGALLLGTWQGIFVAEHRSGAHRREVILQVIGGRHEER